MSHTEGAGLSHTDPCGLSHTAFGATSAPFANTFPIGNDVAPHDSSSLPLVTLRRCPSRLFDEDSSGVFVLCSKIGCISEIQRKTSFPLVFRSICTIFAARNSKQRRLWKQEPSTYTSAYPVRTALTCWSASSLLTLSSSSRRPGHQGRASGSTAMRHFAASSVQVHRRRNS